MSYKWFFWVVFPILLVSVFSLAGFTIQDRLEVEQRLTHYETWMPEVNKRLERIENKLELVLENQK